MNKTIIMKFKSALLLILLFSISILGLLGQNKKYASNIISKLSSQNFWGRGYVNNGDLKAAMFIADEFQKNGANPIEKSYLLPFDISINSFPKPITLEVDNLKLIPGKDFMVGGGSPKTEGDFEIIYLDTKDLKSALEKGTKYEGKIVALEAINIKNNETYSLGASGYIFTYKKKIFWRMSDAVAVNPYFYFYAIDSLIKNAKTAIVDISNEFYPVYKTSNVAAKIAGKKYPDSAFIFTAHYDHLGMMGEVMFPGANDNASGIAMLLDMAKHYSKPENQPDYSIIFMAFAAEECGILGAKHMAKNPIIPLTQIKFLVNLDMVGTGSEGIGMVNAKVEPRADSLIQTINNENNFFNNIHSRGASCISDHCPFAEKGVPTIFIYTRGKEYSHYHTPDDKGPVPLTKWNELFSLLDIFIKTY
jgi:aminopeptidase YwaD